MFFYRLQTKLHDLIVFGANKQEVRDRLAKYDPKNLNESETRYLKLKKFTNRVIDLHEITKTVVPPEKKPSAVPERAKLYQVTTKTDVYHILAKTEGEAKTKVGIAANVTDIKEVKTGVAHIRRLPEDEA